MANSMSEFASKLVISVLGTVLAALAIGFFALLWLGSRSATDGADELRKRNSQLESRILVLEQNALQIQLHDIPLAELKDGYNDKKFYENPLFLAQSMRRWGEKNSYNGQPIVMVLPKWEWSDDKGDDSGIAGAFIITKMSLSNHP